MDEFVSCFGVQVGERVAALLAERVFRTGEAVGGADREVLVDEGSGATVLAGERVVCVPEKLEGRFQAWCVRSNRLG
ncbi:hypothetical protein ACFU98_14040 [Streptomyces sp. NPDC057575]|uniref:hypothetical protein n=1 Tax=unclassified Streptomyces TaxID=2593676 RepID=UPI0036BA7273